MSRLHFLAAASPKAVDLLDEVVCLAIYGKRTLGDTLISIGADVGAEEPPAEVEIETDESRPALILVGTAALQTALRAGDLTVLVDAADGGGLYKVPRTYWNRRNPWGARALEGLDEDDENFGILRGQPLLIDVAEIEKWKGVVRRALETTAGQPLPHIDADTISGVSEAFDDAGLSKLRGVLPANAKPSDRRHEEQAHAAARIIRARKVLPAVAFREVLDSDPTRIEASRLRAIRRSFDKMYDRSGMPYEN